MNTISKISINGTEYDIKDTNTWVSFVGATSATAGTAGYISAPTAGLQDCVFRGNGTWTPMRWPVVAVSGTSNVTQELASNTFYTFGTMSSFSVTLATPLSGYMNEYSFEFDSGSTATTLTVPSTIVWQDGESAPTIEASKHYEFSIKYDQTTLTYYGLYSGW